MEDKIQHSKPVPPFVRFCAANIPMVFDDSLSYYECLCALWKWLQSDVIDVINNNATVTQKWREELTEFESDMRSDFSDLNDAFDTLKTWVETYFDNLDVQEEINNKLDEMAESGQLADIISQYLNSTAIFGYDTVSDMKNAENLVNGSFARTLGYYAKNDGGGALYKIRNITNDDVIDEASIIEMNDSTNTLIAELIYDKEVNVKQFGAKGDDVTDDTIAIQKALDKCKTVIVPAGTYRVSQIELGDGQKLHGVNTASSIIKSVEDNEDNAIITTKTGTVKNIEISDLSILGTYTTLDSRYNPSYATDGIRLVSNDYDGFHYIHNVMIGYCSGYGINALYQRELKIDHVQVFSNFKGISFNVYNGNTTTDSEITNSSIWNCNSYGVEILGGANRFENTKVFYCGYVSTDTPYSDKMSGWFCNSKKCVFVNCQAQECFGHGFEFTNNEDIIAEGIFADNNGLYKDSNWDTAPLPVDQPAIYSGIYLNHVRRSQFSVLGDNFHAGDSPSKATQAYTVYAQNGTDTDLNNIVITDMRQVTGSINYDGTSSNVSVNGQSAYNIIELDVSSLLKTGWTSDSDFPLKIFKIGRTIVINGNVKLTDNSLIPTTLTPILSMPNGYDPTVRTALECHGQDNSSWGPDVCNINCMANSGGGRDIMIQNRTSTNAKVIRINGTYICRF